MRPLCRVFVFVALLTLTGRAQAPDQPAGDGRVSGRVLTSASKPVSDAIVAVALTGDEGPFAWQVWWAGRTDADGFYQFDALPPGRFTVVAVKDGFAGWKSIPTAAPAPIVAGGRVPALALAVDASRATIELVPGGHAAEVNLTMYRPATISGRALRLDDSPAENARVMLYTANDAGVIIGSRGGRPTDGNGRYSFDDLQPGTYYAGIARPERLEDIDPTALVAVTVAEGGSARHVDLPVFAERRLSIRGRIADAGGRMPRMLQFEYGTSGTTHRGLLSTFGPDGTFELVDRDIQPGLVTLMVRGDTEDGQMVSLQTVPVVDGPNDIDIVVGKPGAIRGRVSMPGGLSAIGPALALVRTGFQPLGESDQIIDIAPDGWFEAADVIGEYRLRVSQPPRWTVKSVRRRGIRLANDTLIVGNGDTLDDVEVVIGPP